MKHHPVRIPFDTVRIPFDKVTRADLWRIASPRPMTGPIATRVIRSLLKK